MSVVAWPLNESEAGGDHALIETSLLFYVNDAVLMLISGNLHNKRSEVSIITRSLPASLSFKGRVTRHTTVKRSITPVERLRDIPSGASRFVQYSTRIEKLLFQRS